MEKDSCVVDCRIHLCLYFFNSPTEFDYNNMTEISKLVNLIPVIGRTSQITSKEILNLKSEVMNKGKTDFNIQFLEVDACLKASDYFFLISNFLLPI